MAVHRSKSNPLMSELGHSRPRRTKPHHGPCPLRPRKWTIILVHSRRQLLANAAPLAALEDELPGHRNNFARLVRQLPRTPETNDWPNFRVSTPNLDDGGDCHQD